MVAPIPKVAAVSLASSSAVINLYAGNIVGIGFCKASSALSTMLFCSLGTILSSTALLTTAAGSGVTAPRLRSKLPRSSTSPESIASSAEKVGTNSVSAGAGISSSSRSPTPTPILFKNSSLGISE